jgi:ATP-dependent DNA ligase
MIASAKRKVTVPCIGFTPSPASSAKRGEIVTADRRTVRALRGFAHRCLERAARVVRARLRYRRAGASVFLFAFDLLELDGRDLRREPLEVRKATLASVLRRAGAGVQLNEHLEHEDGEVVFRHSCRMGLEGIVSKRLGSHYRSGRSPDCLKMKNPAAPAVKREAEENWGH